MTEAHAPEIQREAAPDGLRLVQDFINTRDKELKQDDLSNADALRLWLEARGLINSDATVAESDWRHALKVREALRSLLLADGEHGSVSPTAELLDQTGRQAQLSIRFDTQGDAKLAVNAPGVAGALGQILTQVYICTVMGTWARLKVCRADSCQWAFYDHSKNRSGAWCSMAVCGNRYKTRSYRQRKQVSSQ